MSFTVRAWSAGFFYGIYLHSVQMILFNLISLYFAGTILFMIVKYKKKD